MPLELSVLVGLCLCVLVELVIIARPGWDPYRHEIDFVAVLVLPLTVIAISLFYNWAMTKSNLCF